MDSPIIAGALYPNAAGSINPTICKTRFSTSRETRFRTVPSETLNSLAMSVNGLRPSDWRSEIISRSSALTIHTLSNAIFEIYTLYNTKFVFNQGYIPNIVRTMLNSIENVKKCHSTK